MVKMRDIEEFTEDLFEAVKSIKENLAEFTDTEDVIFEVKEKMKELKAL
jgi:cell shape-determining protein MreC|tara:strand:- start:231 stop:377 length:147 start_codon:yes stop_codon:yes gene_type:complete